MTLDDAIDRVERIKDWERDDANVLARDYREAIDVVLTEFRRLRSMDIWERVLSVLKTQGPMKARQVFAVVGCNEREGRDIVAKLIDSGIVKVDLDWRLELRR